MNVTLTGNNDRQNDKAMAMVGQAPEGAEKYMVDFVFGSEPLVSAQQTNWYGDSHVHRWSTGDYTVLTYAMSLEQAKEHAAEVMASYLED